MSTTCRGRVPHAGCAWSTARICSVMNNSCGRFFVLRKEPSSAPGFLVFRKEPSSAPGAAPVVAVASVPVVAVASVPVAPVVASKASASLSASLSAGRADARWGRAAPSPSPPRRYLSRHLAYVSRAVRCSSVSSMLPSWGAGASACSRSLVSATLQRRSALDSDNSSAQ
eukprot:scaffold12767_cov55-Phaeocystis_antarctica.AAC.4